MDEEKIEEELDEVIKEHILNGNVKELLEFVKLHKDKMSLDEITKNLLTASFIKFLKDDAKENSYSLKVISDVAHNILKTYQTKDDKNTKRKIPDSLIIDNVKFFTKIVENENRVYLETIANNNTEQ